MENKTPKYNNPIKSIRIQNFKSLKDVKVDLSHLTFLFGPNSSGKSSFIKALLFLQKNLFPLNTGKTIYKLNNIIDLGSYKDTVTNNDITKDIVFEIEIEDEYNFPDMRLFDLENNKDYEKEIFKKNDLKYEKEQIIKSLSTKNIFKELTTDNFSHYSIFFYGKLLCKYKLHYKITIQFTESNRAKSTKPVFIEMGVKKSSKKKTVNKIDSNLVSIKFRDLNSNNFLELNMNEVYSYLNEKIVQFKPLIKLNYDETTDSIFGSGSNTRYQNDFNGNWIFPYYYSFKEVLNNISGDIFEEDIFTSWNSLEKEVKLKRYYEISKFYYITYYLLPETINYYLNPFHLPTVRELPKPKYLLNEGLFDTNEYYGFLNQLFDAQEEMKAYTKKRNEDHYLTKINKAINSLGFNFKIYIDKNTDVGKIILKHNSSRISNLADESSGLLQILPIIISLFYKSKLVSIEQPELHLHPKLQATLAEILINSRKNQIIETHSEHLIRKLQVLIAQSKIEKNDIVVYYFDKVDGITKLIKMEIEDNGFFKEPWPNGFFDESYNLSKELLFPNKN